MLHFLAAHLSARALDAHLPPLTPPQVAQIFDGEAVDPVRPARLQQPTAVADGVPTREEFAAMKRDVELLGVKLGAGNYYRCCWGGG